MSARPEGSARPWHEDRWISPRAVLTSVLLLVALTLSACGGSSSKTVSTAAQTTTSSSSSAPASSSSGSTATASTSSASSASASTSSAAAPPLCTAPILAGSLLGQQGAAGTGLLGFALRNTSAHSCHTYGYPGVAFLGASGAPLPGTPRRTTIDALGTTHPVALIVAAGATVSFHMTVSHIATSPSSCHTAATLQVIPPDDTETLRIAVPSGVYECGRSTVSSLQPGTSAYPR